MRVVIGTAFAFSVLACGSSARRPPETAVQPAAAFTQGRNDEYLGTEHLLLAIVRDTNDPAAQVLARRGFGIDAAHAQLQRVLGPSR